MKFNLNSFSSPEGLERFKKSSMIFGITCLVIGILFAFWPGSTIITLGRVTGLIIFLAAVIMLVYSLRTKDLPMSLGYQATAVIFLAIGIVVAGAPILLAAIFPVIVGLVLLVHGIKDIIVSAASNRPRDKAWTTRFLLALVQAVFGGSLLFHPWKAARIMTAIIGIALIYLGVVVILMVRRMKKEAPDIIDVDYKEEP